MKKLYLISLIFIGIPIFSIFSAKAQYVNIYNGQGDFRDVFNDEVIDNNGNRYLCGYTVKIGDNSNILVIKLNNAGDTIWSKIYDGPGSGIDEATAITLDQAGNVIVTGYQRGSRTGTDMVTIKYNSQGTLLWSSSYFQASDETERGVSVKTDQNNNVYVAGYFDSDPSLTDNDDIILIKYDASGSVIWQVSKNGSGNGTDRPVKLLLDANSNVFVIARTFNGSDDDYQTMKYDNTGNLIWERFVDRTHNDRPTDLVIDSNNGNIYVTGRSKNITYDYLTIAYDNNGSTLWQTVYDYIDDDRATNIALTSGGEIIVAGQSDYDFSTNFNYNITVVKYNTTGAQVWAQTYAGNAGNDDIPIDMTLDNNGNGYVVATTDTDPGPSVSLDALLLSFSSVTGILTPYIFAGSAADEVPTNILFNGLSLNICGFKEQIPNKDAFACQLNTSGTQLYNKIYFNTGDNSSNSRDIVADSTGNAYVVGYTVEYESDRNYFIQKINPVGQTLWTYTFNGTSTGSVDEAYGVAIDNLGDIIVGGFTKNLGISWDFQIAKFNQSGTLIWSNTYDYNIVSESDKAVDLVIDNQNNIYLTGRSDSDPSIFSNDDFLTVKWNSAGIFQWAARYNGPSDSTDFAKSVKVSTTGNVYIAGKSANASDDDIVLVKYNSTGTQQWLRVYDGGNEDNLESLALDANENIYLTGNTVDNISLDTTGILVKYDNSGNLQWTRKVSKTPGKTCNLSNITVDHNGNIVIAGTTDSDSTYITLNNDFVIASYDNLGNQNWLQTYSFTSNSDEELRDLAVDGGNNIIALGKTVDVNNSNTDYLTLILNSTGSLDTALLYDGSAHKDDIPNKLVILNNDIFVTGSSFNQQDQRDILTIKYANLAVLPVVNNPDAKSYIMSYPNPVRDILCIDLNEMEIQGEINVTIYQLNGQTIYAEQYNSVESKVILDCENLQSGCYIIQIEVSGKKHFSKFIKY